MSFARKFSGGFIERIKSVTFDKRCENAEFRELYGEISRGSLSMYRGDGSKDFAIELAAANSVSRKHVQNVDIIIFHANPCFAVMDMGTTGISHLDSAHVNMNMSEEEFCDLLQSVSYTDMHEIDKNNIYSKLSSWYKQNMYRDVFEKQFSENTQNKIKNG